MELFATVLLSAVVVWFLAEPHFATADSGAAPFEPTGEGSRENLEEQRIRCVQLLKDLELDFSLRKISLDDYNQMKQALTIELAALLERLDRIS